MVMRNAGVRTFGEAARKQRGRCRDAQQKMPLDLVSRMILSLMASPGRILLSAAYGAQAEQRHYGGVGVRPSLHAVLS